jgi:hypothetical protein
MSALGQTMSATTPSNDVPTSKTPPGGLKFKEKIAFSESVYKHCKKYPALQMAAVKRFNTYSDDEMLSALTGRNSSFESTVLSEASKNILCSISGFGVLEQELLKALLSPLADKITPASRPVIPQTFSSTAPVSVFTPEPVKLKKVPVKRLRTVEEPSAFSEYIRNESPPAKTPRRPIVEEAPDWLDLVCELPSASSPVEKTNSTSNVTGSSSSKSNHIQYRLTSGKVKVVAATHSVIRDSLEYCLPPLRNALNIGVRKTEHSDRFRGKVLPHVKDAGCDVCKFAYLYGCKDDRDPKRYRRALNELHEHVIQSKSRQRGPESATNLESDATYGE